VDPRAKRMEPTVEVVAVHHRCRGAAKTGDLASPRTVVASRATVAIPNTTRSKQLTRRKSQAQARRNAECSRAPAVGERSPVVPRGVRGRAGLPRRIGVGVWLKPVLRPMTVDTFTGPADTQMCVNLF
jgi:hypothetical protein